MNLREAAQQALEALERIWEGGLENLSDATHERVMEQLSAALAEPEQEPSGSFVLWENTLCNPLSDPRSMAHSAWHDGYASGVMAEREECAEVCESLLIDHGTFHPDDEVFKDGVIKAAKMCAFLIRDKK